MLGGEVLAGEGEAGGKDDMDGCGDQRVRSHEQPQDSGEEEGSPTGGAEDGEGLGRGVSKGKQKEGKI